MEIREGITFDDVLLVPRYSNIDSRSEIKTDVNLGKGINISVPFISANMKTVTGPSIAMAIADFGGLALLHRFGTLQESISDYLSIMSNDTNYSNRVGVSVGVNSFNYIDEIICETNTKIVCIDVAHGDHAKCLDAVKYISYKYPKVLIIAGNVATGNGAKRLADVGADVVKVGVGNGSVCTTRIETGNGVPQLTALQDVYNTLGKDTNRSVSIIADGGIRNAGDIVKACVFSDAVMLGSLLAGTDEAPGEVVELNGQKYKGYAGSSTYKSSRVEGVAGLIKYKGPVNNVLQKLKEGLQSGLSYQGCRNLSELRESPEFVRISLAGLNESKPHADIKK